MHLVEQSHMRETAGLQDLLGSGSVERGFYMVPGYRDMVPSVLCRLVDYFALESDSSFDPSPRQAEIGKVMWIDSGNTFDPYYIARASARRGLNPTRILRAIQVARPFNAFQLHQMLDKIPTPIVRRPPLVIISDLMKLFYDSEIQEEDVRRAFRQFMVRLSFLQKRAIVVGLVIHAPAVPNREHFLPQLWDLKQQGQYLKQGSRGIWGMPSLPVAARSA